MRGLASSGTLPPLMPAMIWRSVLHKQWQALQSGHPAFDTNGSITISLCGTHGSTNLGSSLRISGRPGKTSISRTTAPELTDSGSILVISGVSQSLTPFGRGSALLMYGRRLAFWVSSPQEAASESYLSILTFFTGISGIALTIWICDTWTVDFHFWYRNFW